MQRLIDWDRASDGQTSFGATIFRQDGSVASVVVSEFMFDGCLLTSDVTFVQGERLRLYRSGQGCILMTVTGVERAQFRTVFVTECQI